MYDDRYFFVILSYNNGIIIDFYDYVNNLSKEKIYLYNKND
jgi:hypothetical protein